MTDEIVQDIHTKFDNRRKKNNRHSTLIENIYQKNKESDYTEKIAALGKSFKYENDRDRYWTEPQFSLLYGTPIFEGSSPSQKLALNHLYWTIFYSGSASSETNAILYNKITAGVFKAVGGYESLCQEIDLETHQEKEHIRAFQKVCRETNMALLGTKGLSQFIYQKSVGGAQSRTANIGNRSNSTTKRQNFFHVNETGSRIVAYQESALGFLVKTMLKKQERFYSHYFRELEQKGRGIAVPSSGWNKRVISDSLMYFLTLNYGSSPFIACCYYFSRFMANILRNIQEHRHSLYLKNLEKQGEDIPVATAISRYHGLDEAFHMTISQTIARDFYKEFPKPTSYEKLIANIIAYQLQRTVNLIDGLSSGLHGNYFGNDSSFMGFVYNLLQTPIFGMSPQEALYWIEKSTCYEHEGLHQTFKYHKSLGSSLRQLASNLDYLWPVNREMRLLDGRISIDKAIQSNIQTFERFSNSVSS